MIQHTKYYIFDEVNSKLIQINPKNLIISVKMFAAGKGIQCLRGNIKVPHADKF